MNMPVVADSDALAQRALARFLPADGNPWGIAFSSVVRRRRDHRPFSTVAWYELKAPERSVVVVLKLSHRAPGEALTRSIHRQVIDAAAFAQITSHPRTRVLTPLAAYGDLGAVFTQAVDAACLSDTIVRAVRWGGDGLEGTVRGCWLAGRWLRDVQIATEHDKVLRTPERLARPLHTRIERLVALGRAFGLTAEQAEALHRWTDDVAARVPECDRRTVRAHGDFGPGNLLFDGEHLWVLDFATAHDGPVLLDATRFLHQLRLVGAKPGHRRGTLRALEDAFLDGLGRPELRATTGYQLFMARHTLTHWTGRARHRSARWWSRTYDRWICRGHRRMLLAAARG